MMPKARWFIGTLLGLLLLAPALHAQTNAALAETLFQEGKRLMGEKNYALACPKFQESQRLDPGTGTLLNWGLCLKESGKTASAWVVFNQAVASARAENRTERVALAQSEVDKLSTVVPRIAIQVPTDADAPGLAVTLDGETISAATRGVATPVDPGDHVVKAAAPQRKSWTTTVSVPATPQTYTVVVPKLELGSDAAPPPATGAIEVAPAVTNEAGSAKETVKPKRFVLGLRLNASIPGGTIESGDAELGQSKVKLSDYSKVQGTFWLEAGYRVLPQLMVGAYLSAGAGGVGSLFKEGCSTSGIDCTLVDVRLGLQATYDFPLEKMVPWVGAGIGYEVLSLSVDAPGIDTTTFDASGAEWLLLQGGLDFPVKNLRFGPFLSVTFARFSNGSCSGDGCDPEVSYDVLNPAFHEWIMLGARGTVSL